MPREIESTTNNRLTPAQYPEDARTAAIAMAPSLDLPAGTVIGMIDADNAGAEYATGNLDGSEVAVGLLMNDVTTDADGKVSLKGNEEEQANDTAAIFIRGTFDPADLTGWDADAATALGARILPNGFIQIP